MSVEKNIPVDPSQLESTETLEPIARKDYFFPHISQRRGAEIRIFSIDVTLPTEIPTKDEGISLNVETKSK